MSKGITDRILALHAEHPDWDTVRIAQAVGCDLAYVRAARRRHGIDIPRAPVGTRSAKRQAALAKERERKERELLKKLKAKYE